MSKLLDWIHIFDNKKEVILRITKFCNQKCLFCFTEIDNKTEISYSDIIFEIDEIINNNKDQILDFVITWWEPTIHKNFIDIIDYIYNKNHFITIQSNLVNFSTNKNLINNLIKYKSRISFFVSFHSHIEKIYDSITNTKWQFLYAKNGLKLFIENFDNITINIVINAFNIKFLKDYFEFVWRELYSINTRIKLNLSVMSNVYKYKYIDKLLVKYTDIINIINSSEDIIKKYNIIIGSDFGWPCDLPYCMGNKLFYYKERLDFIREEQNRYIDREKIDICSWCKYINNCSGILKLYLEKFWGEEFKY